MEAVNLKEARRRLGRLVGEAQRGRAVTITRRGIAVARLVPMPGKRRRRIPDLTEFRAGLHMTGESLTDALLAMRREERD